MNRLENVQKLLLDVLSESLELDPSELKPEARFIEDLGVSSLEMVDVIVALEEEFDILISDAEARNIQTVGQAMEHLKSKVLKTA